MRRLKSWLCVGSALLALTACESAQDKLGLNKKSPDEFKVLKRAPLELPPSYALRPPAPGAARPQEQATSDSAAQAVFGNAQPAQASSASGEGLLLEQAGAMNADPSIRQVVDKETSEMVSSDEPVIDKLMSLGRPNAPKASVVDAAKEAERLKENAQSGQPVTEGETPSKVK